MDIIQILGKGLSERNCQSLCVKLEYFSKSSPRPRKMPVLSVGDLMLSLICYFLRY